MRNRTPLVGAILALAAWVRAAPATAATNGGIAFQAFDGRSLRYSRSSPTDPD